MKNNYLLQASSDSTFRIRTYVPRFRLSHTTRIISIERSSRGRRSKYSREKERKGRKKARKHQVESRRAERRRMADRNEDFNWYPWSRTLSLSFCLSPVRGGSLFFFSFFFFFFVIVSFRLSFPYHSFPLDPFSSKTIYRGHPGHSYLYTGERSRGITYALPLLTLIVT